MIPANSIQSESPPNEIVIASGNKKKAMELAALLGEGWVVRTLQEIGFEEEIIEDGPTFEANARIKARAVAGRCPGWLLADDSGLEVDALNGAPGVFSARYAGEPSNDLKNVEKLLHELDGVPASERGARFRCVLVLFRDGIEAGVFDGTCEGRIAFMPEGDSGFGYDPVFIPQGYERTFACMNAAEKGRFSHRGQAMAKLKSFFRNFV